jgi:hypothetical protein
MDNPIVVDIKTDKNMFLDNTRTSITHLTIVSQLFRHGAVKYAKFGGFDAGRADGRRAQGIPGRNKIRGFLIPPSDGMGAERKVFLGGIKFGGF